MKATIAIQVNGTQASFEVFYTIKDGSLILSSHTSNAEEKIGRDVKDLLEDIEWDNIRATDPKE